MLKMLYTLVLLPINCHNTTLNGISFLNSCDIFIVIKETHNTNTNPEEFFDTYSKVILNKKDRHSHTKI